jgi:M6 family metalloprotease-like protein
VPLIVTSVCKRSHEQEGSTLRTWYRRALMSALALALFLPTSVPSASAQRLPSSITAQQVSISGLLTIRYGDPQPGSRRPGLEVVSVTDSIGNRVIVNVDPSTQLSEPLHGLNGMRVTVTGIPAASAADGSVASQPTIAAQQIRRQPGVRAAVRTIGTVRWATLLCRFADDGPETVAPYPVITYFQPLILGPSPSAESYWKESSRNLVNFDGSTFHDWTALPKTRAQYQAPGTPEGVDLELLATDCASAAGAGLDFNQYGGVNIVVSRTLYVPPAQEAAWGGLTGIALGGVNKPDGWPITWLPEFAYKTQNVVAHEMGHAFKLPHSSGPYTQTYDSKWDVMSEGGMCRTPDPKYGCLGAHTVAYHKEIAEWIPAERRFNYAGTAQTIALSRTALPDETAGTFWTARIPIPGSATEFYSVEARKFVGYDTDAPFESVLVSRVNTTRTQRTAQVVDIDNNQDPNDAAAAWIPGETFTDAASNITVSVLASTATGFSVRIGPVNTTTPPPPATRAGTVRVSSRWVSAGRLEVSVDAVGTAAAPTNVLRELRFGAATNAVVDLGNGAAPFAGNQTIAVPGTPAHTTFFVIRVAPGAFLVRLEVVDGVGPWPTFVGGGAGVP